MKREHEKIYDDVKQWQDMTQAKAKEVFTFTNHTHDWSKYGQDTGASWNQTGH
jgi:hypothetical protein